MELTRGLIDAVCRATEALSKEEGNEKNNQALDLLEGWIKRALDEVLKTEELHRKEIKDGLQRVVG